MATQVPIEELQRCLLHYWFISNRGGERVLAEIARLIKPNFCYTHLLDTEIISGLGLDCDVNESAYASIPFARRAYKLLFPFMYLASVLLPVKSADLIISSESGPIKGVRKRTGAIHICYCHSPLRILWVPVLWYKPVLGKMAYILPLLRWPLRLIDKLTARSVDCFIANSTYIQKRISRAYGRSSVVIHPPVDVDRFGISENKGDYFLWLGELVSYKRPDLVIEAFSRNRLPLKVIGQGPMLEKLKIDSAENIQFLERVSDDELPLLLSRARALVFGGIEDFGIVFVEALASGTPIIAYREGGVLDIVEDGLSGVLFDEQSVAGLLKGMDKFLAVETGFDAQELNLRAQKFRPERFREEFMGVVNAELEKRGMPSA